VSRQTLDLAPIHAVILIDFLWLGFFRNTSWGSFFVSALLTFVWAEIDGVKVPAGTTGVIPIYAIHRHHAYWDDPHRFDPGRFAPGRAPKPTRFQFLPFGAGPRICIGAAFAMIEATIMLAEFVRAARFEVDPDFDPQPSARMFLLPRHGMMRVTMR
jgi:cytochrome P450